MSSPGRPSLSSSSTTSSSHTTLAHRADHPPHTPRHLPPLDHAPLPELRSKSSKSSLHSARPSASNATRFMRPGLASLSSEHLALSPKDRLNVLLNKPLESKPAPVAEPAPSLRPSPPAPALQQSPDAAPRPPPSAGSSSFAAPHAGRPSLPRNFSHDSTMSSASAPPIAAPSSTTASTMHSSQSSTSSTSAPQPLQLPSVATLVANAGSPEAAIEKLLAEQRTQNVRSEQLWRLVEKQRSMLLGLNKDLERAMKDKERYRRKLKDLQAIHASSASGDLEYGQDANTSQPSLPSHRNLVSVDSIASSVLPARDLRDHEVRGRADSKLSQRTDISAPSPPLGPQMMSLSTPQETDEIADHLPALQPTISAGDIRKPSISSPTEKRRGAPAPLDLTNAKPTSPRSAIQTLHESDSDEDVRSNRAFNEFERGRRRTREDDDRIRDAIAIEEEEAARGQSSKNKKSKSKSKPAEQSVAEAPQHSAVQALRPPPPASHDVPLGLGYGLPSSPRAPLLGGLQSPLQSSMGSIAGALHPQTQRVMMNSLPPKSPGLPMSPRPGDRPFNAPVPRLPKEPLMSPGPMSPRSGLPLSPRAPRGPIPLPLTGHPLAATAPHYVQIDSVSYHGPAPSLAQRLVPGAEPSRPAQLPHKESSNSKPGDVFKGFRSDEYPGLLLPPNALPLVSVQIHSSRLKPARQSYLPKTSDEDDVVTLAIHSRSGKEQLWRVEKTLTLLGDLNSKIKRASSFQGKLPDRKNFASHAPIHLDDRRAALYEYFETMLETPMDDKAALMVCDFFSTNVIGAEAGEWPHHDEDSGVAMSNGLESLPRKEGYLAKKGKQFGGWKARFFVLEDGFLKYLEGPHGQVLGQIKLHRAKIAKQNAKDSDEDSEFRHAFLVLERRRRDSSSLIRHVLCAESDQERDEWVQALMYHVGDDDQQSLVDPGSPRSPLHSPKLGGDEFQPSLTRSRENSDPDTQVQAIMYEQTAAGDLPIISGPSKNSSGTPSPTQPYGHLTSGSQSSLIPTISGPVGGGPIQNAMAWGNKSPSPSLSKEMRKRSMFGFMSRGSEDGVAANKTGRSTSANRAQDLPVRPVFGIPLIEAAAMCPPVGMDVCLPAPVYRAIEYLEARNAALEEGIFRLSGSNLTVKALKERFNTEGDVKLLEGPYYDVHAVSSLLKLFLRELPETVLTKELHLDFLKVLDIDNQPSKVAAVNILVHKLPEANHQLLETLSRFLIDVVNNQDTNKMTIRNVGIVFAPTLNIPAPLISLFLTSHDAIFARDISDQTEITTSPILESLTTPSPSDDVDIRSPRKQMFTDVATPSYAQTSFSGLDRTAHEGNYAPLQQSASAPQGVPQWYQYQPRTQQQYPSSLAQLLQGSADGYGSLNAALSQNTGPPPPPAAGGVVSIPLTTSKSAGEPSRREDSSERNLAAVKKNRRESMFLGVNGNSRQNSSDSNTSNAGLIVNSGPGNTPGMNTLDGRRKSSYQRLREMTGLSEVKEVS